MLITQGLDGRNREAGFRIAGLYDAEGTALEKQFVFTGVGALQNMVEADGGHRGFHQAGGRALRARRSNGICPASSPTLDVMDWQELEPQAAAMFVYVDSAILIWFLVIMGALIFGLVNTLITAVMERIREFGMLRAVGMKPAR